MLAASAGDTYRWIGANSRKDCRAMRTPFILLAVATLGVVLVGCSELRGETITRAEAANDHRVMRLKVIHVYDNSNNDYTTEFRVWHIVEVEVMEGPEARVGKTLDLPYDDFTAAAPPLPGDVVTVAPADWVGAGEHRKQRAFGE
jgi:hypothetical protein